MPETTAAFNPQQTINDAIQVMFPLPCVVEIRSPKAGKNGTICGYFELPQHIDRMVNAIMEISGDYNVYWTINPVDRSLLARSANKLRHHMETTTGDREIIQRQWLPLDFDPQRATGISSTDEEKRAARTLASKVKKWLKGEMGWPDPVVADSGNGFHLLYRIDLPNDDESRELLKAVLDVLAHKFDTTSVKIDQKLFNASRILKAYGSLAVKGDNILERPHRMAQMFAPPERIEIVSKALLTALAAEAPKPEKKKSSPTAKTPGGWTPALVEQVLDEADVGRGEAMEYKNVSKWQHDCLANPDHRKPDAYTILDADGYAHHYCSHNTCSDMRDEDWRGLWEERTGETYPWPRRRKLDSGVNGVDTLPESPYLSPKGSFRESVSTSDTTSDSVRHSDVGNAMRLAKLCGEDIIYCRQSDEYYVWDGTRWMRDLNSVDMLRLAKAVTEEMFQEAESLGEDAKKALRSHALKSQSVARLSGMVNLAKIHVRNVNRGDFDKDPWVFNCTTGTIDLRTGKCRAHDHKDLISKLAPVKYDPAADCPLWKKCLTDWMLGDEQKVGYLQRQAGYTLTGCTNEEVMPILWGAGRNGKTKFYVTIYNVLGDGEYAKAANFDSFVVKKGDDGMPNDIAGWCGMRLIVAAEGEHSKRLAEAKLKLCIGRDPVVGEFKYQEEFTYVPTYKVWLITNPKPRIVGTTEAIWDKIHFVAWNRYYRPEERDTELQEKLNTEASGILNWMIEGCLQWQKKGLALPASMKEDTDAYRREQDVVGRFIDEECLVNDEFTSPKNLTYHCFKDWAEDAGEHYTMTQVEFNEKMLSKFGEGRSKSGRFWRGFKLKRHESDFETGLAERGLTPESLKKSIQ